MSILEPQVILVDENDREIGTAPKLDAHKQSLRHRAFSVFVLRHSPQDTEVLLHKRHPEKYHCGGLWTNTCCSHPYPGEDTIKAGERRLFEEMGIKAILKEVGVFHYIAKFDNGLTENEVDHVLIGELQQDTFIVNPEEVVDYQWISKSDLHRDIEQNPAKYTPWLLPALKFIG